MNPKQRIERLEKMLPNGLAAALTGRYEPIDFDDLEIAINDMGQADISPYWSIWFLSGTKTEQQCEIEKYRADPAYKLRPVDPPDLADIRVKFVNGGCIDAIFLKLAKHEARQRAVSIKLLS